jgi:ribosomal protein S18 acetylase RimI-like enzyme
LIRSVKKSDYKEIYNLIKEHFKTKDAIFMSSGYTTEFTISIEQFNSVIKNLYCLVDIDNGIITGFIIYNISKTLDTYKDILQIKELYVKPEFRGKGIATNLLKYIKLDKEIWLNCHKDNKIPLELYKKLGFKIDDQWIQMSLNA